MFMLVLSIAKTTHNFETKYQILDFNFSTGCYGIKFTKACFQSKYTAVNVCPNLNIYPGLNCKANKLHLLYVRDVYLIFF